MHSPAAHCSKGVNNSNIWGLSYSSLIVSSIMKPYLKMSCHKFPQSSQSYLEV